MRARLIVAVSALLIAAGLVATGGTFASGEKVRATCLGAPATIVGTAGADVLRGTQKRDVIVALGGADRLYGRGGDDLLCGGAGNDLLDGGPGRNQVDGGAGRDRCLRAARTSGCEKPQPPSLPSVEGVTLDVDRVSLSSYRGRALFVNVWAAW